MDGVSNFYNVGDWEQRLIWCDHSLQVVLIHCEVFILSRLKIRTYWSIKGETLEIITSSYKDFL